MNGQVVFTRGEMALETRHGEAVSTAVVGRRHWEDLAQWIECRESWLKAMREESGRENTVAAYSRDWSEFVAFIGGGFTLRQAQGAAQPTEPRALWEVDGRTAAAWKEQLIGRGLADTTVNRKLAALSSFYSFAGTTFLVDVPGQLRATPLWPIEYFGNPFHQVKRVKISKSERKGRRAYPKPDETRKIFDAMMPLTRPIDWRDMAILFGTYMTTRRYSEWVVMRWKDIHEGEEGFYFDFVNKGGEPDEQYLEPELYQLIVRYLQEAGRWPLRPDDFIFVALSDQARRLRKATQIVMQPECVLIEWVKGNGEKVQTGEVVARVRFRGCVDGTLAAGRDGELRVYAQHRPLEGGNTEIGKVLGDFILNENYVIGNKPLTNHSVNAMFKRRAAAAGVEASKAHVHGLRHSRANREWKRDPKQRDIVYLKNLLNHASLSTTEMYGQETFEEPEDHLSATAWVEMAPKQLVLDLAKGMKGSQENRC